LAQREVEKDRKWEATKTELDDTRAELDDTRADLDDTKAKLELLEEFKTEARAQMTEQAKELAEIKALLQGQARSNP
jgi:septal ring factor EnvC (AmiA/AmiB activator)